HSRDEPSSSCNDEPGHSGRGQSAVLRAMPADDLDYQPVARMIIARYGACAPEVLEGFISAHRQIGDKESATMWAAVAEAVARILRSPSASVSPMPATGIE